MFAYVDIQFHIIAFLFPRTIQVDGSRVGMAGGGGGGVGMIKGEKRQSEVSVGNKYQTELHVMGHKRWTSPQEGKRKNENSPQKLCLHMCLSIAPSRYLLSTSTLTLHSYRGCLLKKIDILYHKKIEMILSIGENWCLRNMF